MALPGIFIAKKQKIPFILYVTDLWPESLLFASKINSELFNLILNKIVDYIYENSSNILISSKGYKTPISKRVNDINKIIYWPQYPEELYKPYIENNSKDKNLSNKLFTITYTGNIGFAQDFEVLVNAVKLLKDEGLKIKVNIVGNGRFLSTFKNLVIKSNTSEYFSFLGSKPPIEIPKILYLSDVAYLSLAKEELFEYTLPSKFQTYLACGIPVLASINGETSRIINEANCGYSSNAGNYKDLAENIKKMSQLEKHELRKLGLNGLFYSKRFFKKNKLLNTLDYIIQNSKIVHN
jgi:glycosyltransferase involved in cell wall biosynthesis